MRLSLDFTVCYGLLKVYYNSADFLNTLIVFITNQMGVTPQRASMYFEKIWLSAVHIFQQSSLM